MTSRASRLDYTFQTTGKGDSDINTFNFTVGSNLADGRGNAVLGLSWSERDGTLLGVALSSVASAS